LTLGYAQVELLKNKLWGMHFYVKYMNFA
jgi:hypothetical protein